MDPASDTGIDAQKFSYVTNRENLYMTVHWYHSFHTEMKAYRQMQLLFIDNKSIPITLMESNLFH